MEDYSELINRCKGKEQEAIIKGIAMGAVILSRMGPIYIKGSVKTFQDLALQFSPRLTSITTISDFDSFHELFGGLVNRCVNVRQWQVPLPV